MQTIKIFPRRAVNRTNSPRDIILPIPPSTKDTFVVATCLTLIHSPIMRQGHRKITQSGLFVTSKTSQCVNNSSMSPAKYDKQVESILLFYLLLVNIAPECLSAVVCKHYPLYLIALRKNVELLPPGYKHNIRVTCYTFQQNEFLSGLAFESDRLHTLIFNTTVINYMGYETRRFHAILLIQLPHRRPIQLI